MDDRTKGLKVLGARKERGLKQDEAAQLLGWGGDRLSALENGRNVKGLRAEDMQALERVLGVPIGLWFATEAPEPPGSAATWGERFEGEGRKI